MLAVIEKSFERIWQKCTNKIPLEHSESFESLWNRRLELKKNPRGNDSSFENKLALVLSVTYDIERYVISSCLKCGSSSNLLISNVIETLNRIKLQRITRPRIKLTSDDIRKIVLDHFICVDENELIERIGADKYFEYKANEDLYNKSILNEIPGIMIDACKLRGLCEIDL